MTGWTDKIVFVRFSIKYKIKDRTQVDAVLTELYICKSSIYIIYSS